MRAVSISAAAAVAGALLLAVAAGRAQDAKSKTWQSLFNGRNLDGWQVVNAGVWTVEDGQIVVRRRPNDTSGGWLVTKKDFRDFILRLKFHPGSNAFNSGVLIRDPGHAMVSRPAFHGFEIQLQQGEPDPNTNGAIYDVARAYPKILDPQAWSQIEIRCVGDHISTFINGQRMAETHTRRSYSGGVGMQMHGGKDQLEYRFKDIEIQELPPERPEALMLEEQLERNPAEFQPLWSSGAMADSLTTSKGWTLEKGVLRGESGSVWSGVLTKSTYTNYLLTFDARVPKTSEGVVSLRHPGGSQAGDPAAGYECAVAESPDSPSGSILGLAPGMVTSDWMTTIHRPDRWNNFRVYVSGDHVVTYVNLSKTADVHASRPASGHIGFYAKAGSTVEFQNVRIKVIR
ncbi:MAG TPA: DUF1080 domain-containing protein [Bryobacteraceae bacterium]|nr:DUF1080 domain-containing protein [Bryobacteraceae bacterium]